MPRNMSFAMTTDQVLNRTKTVTRRLGWDNLKPGTRLNAVNRVMGFKKGEKSERLALIEVVSAEYSVLNRITKEDVIKEGFPEWSPQQFVDMLVSKFNIHPGTVVNRIEFRYIPDDEQGELF